LLVNIEVKADLRRRGPLIRALAALLAPRADERERLLLSSFHPQFVWSLARLLPEFGVAWLVHEGQPLLRRAPGFRALGAVGVNPQHTLLSSASVREARRTGALIATWTVNDPELARAYAKFGVDAIISDCPGAILEALARAPELP
jgi:glycerophosphoryl diester phosphodiesterase